MFVSKAYRFEMFVWFFIQIVCEETKCIKNFFEYEINVRFIILCRAKIMVTIIAYIVTNLSAT